MQLVNRFIDSHEGIPIKKIVLLLWKTVHVSGSMRLLGQGGSRYVTKRVKTVGRVPSAHNISALRILYLAHFSVLRHHIIYIYIYILIILVCSSPIVFQVTCGGLEQQKERKAEARIAAGLPADFSPEPERTNTTSDFSLPPPKVCMSLRATFEMRWKRRKPCLCHIKWDRRHWKKWLLELKFLNLDPATTTTTTAAIVIATFTISYFHLAMGWRTL